MLPRPAIVSLISFVNSAGAVARNAAEVRAPHLAPRGGAACDADTDCNLNGICKSSKCRCDQGWTGTTCGVLDLTPVKLADEAAYSGLIWPPSRDMSAWGGNVIPSGTTEGGFDLYVSEMVNHCGLSTWQTNSRIVHASASKLEGPYVLREELMPPFAHNANPAVIPASEEVAVFHVGDGENSKGIVKCKNGTTPIEIAESGEARNDLESEARAAKPCTYSAKDYEKIPLSKSLSVLHAPEGSTGRWKAEPQTCVGPNLDEKNIGGCPHFSNAAPLILANGTTLIVHSGCHGWQQAGLNLAVAPEWKGPYRPMKGVNGSDGRGRNAWYTPSIDTTSNPRHADGGTDPFFWMDPRGRYHVLLHLHWDDGDKGGHAFSEDGVRWTTSLDQPWGETVALSDGSSIEYLFRQRPHLVLNGDGVPGVSPSGSPAALVTGMKAFSKDPRGQLPWMKWCRGAGPGCDSTFTHLQPIRTSEHHSEVVV